MTPSDDQIRQEAEKIADARFILPPSDIPLRHTKLAAIKLGIKRGIEICAEKPELAHIFAYCKGREDTHAERDRELMELAKRYRAQGNSLNYGSTVVIELEKLIRQRTE